MTPSASNGTSPLPRGGAEDRRHHRQLMRRTLLHLLSIYFLPLLLLTVYFHVQTASLQEEGRESHLRSVAEYQARMLDLFIRERAADLSNLIDSLDFARDPSPDAMGAHLADLQRASGTFVDLGVFDAAGNQVAYAGPFPVLEERNYAGEEWFAELRADDREFVITDIYLGFRQRPHFTIAVDRVVAGRTVVLRATLDPDRMYDFITSTTGAQDVLTSTVNRSGVYQVVTSNVGSPLAESSLAPPRSPAVGSARVAVGDRDVTYGYAWLVEADWAIITQGMAREAGAFGLSEDFKIAVVAVPVFVLIFLITYLRARRIVRVEEERDETRLQLVHSAKLASVGELAGGIAHEINNPLAIISEEAGLMQDLISSEYGRTITPAEMVPQLERIKEAVFRCRDITRKLLGFVRRTDYRLEKHHVPDLVEEVVNDFFVHKLELANIELTRRYAPDLPPVLTDANQLGQVVINLLNNAVDAVGESGRIAIDVRRAERTVRIAVRDDGTGMSEEQLQRIFLPFFTTKETGKGTGLGLSVSSGIIEGLGGTIEVVSKQGEGSTFTIVLPL